MLTPGFLVGFVLLNLNLLCNVLQIVVCPSVLFRLVNVLFVFLRFAVSGYPFKYLLTFLRINKFNFIF